MFVRFPLENESNLILGVNWPIISVNDHFSVSEFSQKSRSFKMSCSWNTQALKRYDVSFRWGRPVSLFQNRFVFSHEYFLYSTNHHTVEQKTIWGERPERMHRLHAPVPLCVVQFTTGSNRKQMGRNRLSLLLVVYTKDSNIHTLILVCCVPNSERL